MSINSKKIAGLMGCMVLVVAAMVFIATQASHKSIAAEGMADDVYATVNGKDITRADAESFARYVMQAEGTDVTDEVLKRAAQEIVNMEALYSFPKAKEIQATAEFKTMARFQGTNVLFGGIARDKVDGALDDDALAAEYKDYADDFKSETEVKARHILFKTEDKAGAMAAIKRLDNGEKFEDLAKELSTGPSGPQGGDLGYFSKGAMVPEFDKVVFVLNKGDFTKEPVETKFGWHLILVEDSRQTSPKPKEEMEAQLAQMIQMNIVSELKAAINGASDIVFNTKHFPK